MNTSSDAAEQVVRLTLDGVEVAAKLTGAGAKQVAVMLYAVLRDQKKTKGKTRLTNMLKSGKELSVFAVRDNDLQKFCSEAKKYGVLYCVLRDKDASDGLTDIMIKAEDKSKVNRIFERFELGSVDLAAVKSELSKVSERPPEIGGNSEKRISETDTEKFAEAIMKKPDEKQEAAQAGNPTVAKTAKSHQSEPSLNNTGATTENAEKRPSVKKEMEEIKIQMEKEAAAKKPVHSKTDAPLPTPKKRKERTGK